MFFHKISVKLENSLPSSFFVKTAACCREDIENIYHIGINWYFIHHWLTIMQLIQQKIDRGSKCILEMKLEALSSWHPEKTKRKLVQRTRLNESVENGKGGEVLPSTKKRKDQTKTSTQRINVAIGVLLHPRRQKTLLVLLKGTNLEKRSASILSVSFCHLIHHRHFLPQSLQRKEVEEVRWVADSKLYLRKLSSDKIFPLTWSNIPIHILKLMWKR